MYDLHQSKVIQTIIKKSSQIIPFLDKPKKKEKKNETLPVVS